MPPLLRGSTLYVCMYVCMEVVVLKFMCMYVLGNRANACSILTSMHIHTSTHAYIHSYTHAYIHSFLLIYFFVFISFFVCMYVCMCGSSNAGENGAGDSVSLMGKIDKIKTKADLMRFWQQYKALHYSGATYI